MSATLTYDPPVGALGSWLGRRGFGVMLCAGLGVLGKLGFGWIADRQSVRRVVVMVIILQLTGQFLMYTSDEFGASLWVRRSLDWV